MGLEWDMPDAHPQSLSQSAASLYYCCYGERKQGEQMRQALTKMLARGRLDLFLAAHFHAPYLQLASALSGSQNEHNCVEPESLSGGGHIYRSTHIGSDA